MTLDILMAGHLRFMKQAGFDVLAVSSPGPELEAVAEREGVQVAEIPMRRALSPLHDLVALQRLVRLMRRTRPGIVNAGTPKAGLLCMIASRLLRVPVRIYTVRGLKGETASGWRRKLLDATERLASWCATDVVCVSPSLRDLYLDEKLAPQEKVVVLGHGSSNGVDLERFWSSPERRSEARAALGLGEETPVIGFVGRLVHDKGIGELIEAFGLVRDRCPDATLVLAGGFEDGDPVGSEVQRLIAEAPRIVHLGEVRDTARIYPAFDVFAFPSAREGLPNAPLEAAACAVPTVGFDATGTRDVVVHGRTGMLVPLADTDALASGLLTYVEDQEVRVEHGEMALKLVSERFGRATVWRDLLAWYRNRLGSTAPGRAAALGGDPDCGPLASTPFTEPAGRTARPTS